MIAPVGIEAGRPDRPAEPVRPAAGRWHSGAQSREIDLLTRPMQLDDLVPRSRKPRLDSFLSNV